MKNLDYYKNNAEPDYMTTPVSVLRYITELEEAQNRGQELHRHIKGVSTGGIKEWYKAMYADDELGEEINPNATFEGLENNIPDVYQYLDVADSVVRERVFEELSNRMDVPYVVVYNMWLDV